MMKSKRIRFIALLVILLVLVRWAYKYSPYRVEFLGHYEKVWAHRVNSVEKLESTLRFFKGIELDLVYLPKEGVFDVNHPPRKSIGLTFETYLSHIQQEAFPNMWLDIKNLTAENSETILNHIETLCNAYNINKKRFLIESKDPEALIPFLEKGYSVSYYLPNDLSKTNRAILKTYSNMGVSANSIHYEYLATHFPNHNKYLWKIDPLSWSSYFNTKKALNDPTVKVVLSKFRSFKGNR